MNDGVKKMKKLIFIYLVLVSCVLGQSKVGSTAAPFLTIGVGPRATAMGGAYIATANDVTSLYWNPAGIARSEASGAMFSYSDWLADIKYNWAGAMLNLGGMGTVGLSLGYLDYGDIPITTLGQPEGTGENYNPSDMVIGLTYAYNLTDRFAIGGTVKYISQTIWNSSASAVGVDIGTLFQSDLLGLRIAATISNFGTEMQIDGKDLFIQYDIDESIYGNNDQILSRLNTDVFPLPLTFRVGVAMDVLNIESHRLTIGADASHPNDNDESLNLGAEYELFKMISLRAGYKSLFLDNSEEGLTLGFGLKYDFAPNLGLFVDYAYQDLGKFDYAQQFSLGIRF